MPAELPAGIAQAIGVSIVRREQHQPQVLVGVGGEHHGPGMLPAQAAEGVEVLLSSIAVLRRLRPEV